MKSKNIEQTISQETSQGRDIDVEIAMTYEPPPEMRNMVYEHCLSLGEGNFYKMKMPASE